MPSDRRSGDGVDRGETGLDVDQRRAVAAIEPDHVEPRSLYSTSCTTLEAIEFGRAGERNAKVPCGFLWWFGACSRMSRAASSMK
jgi:hypothetical protein